MILRFWHDTACWALLVILFLAPWLMGCIPPWAEYALIYSLLSVVAVYFLTSCIGRSFGFFHWVPLLAILWILGHGWWMTWNGQFILDPQSHQLIPISSPFPNLRGSLDHDASFRIMLRISALAGAFWIISSISPHPHWRKRITTTIGLSAATLLLFGIFQKISGNEGFWPQYGRNVWPFATYYYHGNAGAFINLTFPLITALAWKATFIDSVPITRAIWLSSFVLSVAAALVNSSKAALLIFVVTFLGMLMLIAWFSRKVRIDWRSLSSLLIGMGIIIAAVGIVTFSGDTTQAIQRWNHALNSRVPITTGRLGITETLINFIPAAGTWGLGPNSFEAVFPYMARISHAPGGYWQFAHQDYLQTLVEWGYAGFAAWSILVVGGVLMLLWMLTFKRKDVRKRDQFLLCCLLAAIGGCCIHSLVDFPLQIASLQLYFTTFLAMAWSSPRWEKPSRVKIEPSN